jgi:hypothetical protein
VVLFCNEEPGIAFLTQYKTDNNNSSLYFLMLA